MLQILLLIFLLSCGGKPNLDDEPDFLTVCTFNISWLGDGIDDKISRKNKDYKQIAEIIKQTHADIIAVQEIENPAAMNKLIKFLPNYSYYLGKNGGLQNIGVIYKKNIQLDNLGEYMPLEVEKDRTRPGLILQGKKGNFDWIMLVVHFKSTSGFDDTPEKKEESRVIRTSQAEIVSHWADSVLNYSKEKDLIIVGDFNDYPNRKNDNTVYPISENLSLRFLTKDLKSCKFENLFGIDHIVASNSAYNRYLKNSEFVFDIYSSLPEKLIEKISDHCPVLVKFEVKSKDND